MARKKKKKMSRRDYFSAVKLEANRRHVRGFVKMKQAEGVKPGRLKKYCGMLRNLSNWLGKDFKKATKKDLEKLVIKVNKKDYSEFTKADYRRSIKTLYKWLEGENDSCPKKAKWINGKAGKRTSVTASDLLSMDEIKGMVTAAQTLRNKALISVLAETGVRISELLGMRIKDIEIDDVMITIEVDGKTGDRKVFVRAYRQHLINWLNSHPNADKRDAPVWASGRSVKAAVSGKRVNDMLKRVATRAGVSKYKYNGNRNPEHVSGKKISAHLFRHSACTRLSSKLTDSEMKILFGWSATSRMPAVYSHLSSHDIKNSMAAKVYGLSSEEIKKREDSDKPKICPSCGKENPVDARFCNCGTVLDLGTAIKLDSRLREARRAEDLALGDVDDPVKMYAQVKELERRMRKYAEAAQG